MSTYVPSRLMSLKFLDLSFFVVGGGFFGHVVVVGFVVVAAVNFSSKFESLTPVRNW